MHKFKIHNTQIFQYAPTWLDLFNCFKGLRPPWNNSASWGESFFSLKKENEAYAPRQLEMESNGFFTVLYLPKGKVGGIRRTISRINIFFLSKEVSKNILWAWNCQESKLNFQPWQHFRRSWTLNTFFLEIHIFQLKFKNIIVSLMVMNKIFQKLFPPTQQGLDFFTTAGFECLHLIDHDNSVRPFYIYSGLCIYHDSMALQTERHMVLDTVSVSWNSQLSV